MQRIRLGWSAVRKHLGMLAAVTLVAWWLGGQLGPPGVRAGSWLFRPSYYSHRPALPVQVGHRVSVRPGYHYSEFYRAGYFLKNTSRSLRAPDQFFYAEGWIQHRWR